MAAEDASPYGVEGPSPEAGGLFPELLPDPVLHLPRRLVGEGDGEDPMGRHAVVTDEVADSGGENPSLPRPRSRKHQKGSLKMLHRLPLLRVQLRNLGSSSGAGRGS